MFRGDGLKLSAESGMLFPLSLELDALAFLDAAEIADHSKRWKISVRLNDENGIAGVIRPETDALDGADEGAAGVREKGALGLRFHPIVAGGARGIVWDAPGHSRSCVSADLASFQSLSSSLSGTSSGLMPRSRRVDSMW